MAPDLNAVKLQAEIDKLNAEKVKLVSERAKLDAEREDIVKPVYKKTQWYGHMVTLILAIFTPLAAFIYAEKTHFFETKTSEIKAANDVVEAKKIGLQYDVAKLDDRKAALTQTVDSLEKTVGALKLRANDEENIINTYRSKLSQSQKDMLECQYQKDLYVIYVRRSNAQIDFLKKQVQDTSAYYTNWLNTATRKAATNNQELFNENLRLHSQNTVLDKALKKCQDQNKQ